MKDFYIRDAAQHENKIITTNFVVSSKQIKPKKNGEPYLALTLCDKSGQIEAKMWDNVADYLAAFEQDDFLKVRGLINKYNARWQLTIYKLKKLEANEVEYEDFLPNCPRDVEELWQTAAQFVSGFKNPYLKELLEAFMNDDEIARAYKRAPAAKTLHHAYIGGLLDHVVSLFNLCDRVCGHYPQIDRDLLLTGAFLHDIGKIHELTYARSFGYSTRGQLLGHMIIELEMLQAKTSRIPGFPDELKTCIEHMLISHHGQYEFGSPKLPMFPEALMLHYLDDLDSKMESMRAQFEKCGDNPDPWAGYNNSMARPLVNPKKLLKTMYEPQAGSPSHEPQESHAGSPSREPEPPPSTKPELAQPHPTQQAQAAIAGDEHD